MSLADLQPREKKILVAGAITLLGFLAYFAVTGSGKKTPAADAKRVEQSREAFLKDLAEYQTLGGTVGKIDQQLDKTPPDYDLFGAVTNILDTLQLRSQARKINPEKGAGTEFYTENYVDLDLQGIYLDDLVELMKKVEELPAFVRVTQLMVKKKSGFTAASAPGEAPENPLDVSIRIAVYARNLGPP